MVNVDSMSIILAKNDEIETGLSVVDKLHISKSKPIVG